ncbi:hypothetical protein [Hyunsoonleella pacifica]|uniref:Uncharacterized protein n=1 Tax=Hyunsoonleella pacifica TaxID=1080224 RepID=A0A4V2JB35_9FLAO|nr:hypothetical protein [Hyunsoonleella pacifica]TBN16663.1 hypothetical protein EYD46_08490 [Hyunsoonleella pacifica]GGD17572.1 hypothetical protein GCM10011368_19360 [Hyunsoonleella pacifica]
MKTLFSYILLFTLAFRPLYNISYVAYFELNIDYIIETYCVNKEKPSLQCNGKCHLANQLSLVSNVDTKEDALSFNSFYEAFIPVYFQKLELNCTTYNNNYFILNNWNYTKAFNSLYKDNLDPPPKVV